MDSNIKLESKEQQEKNCLEMARLAEITNGTTCGICCGRGHDGWNEAGKYYVVCKCILKAADKIRREKRGAKLPIELAPEANN